MKQSIKVNICQYAPVWKLLSFCNHVDTLHVHLVCLLATWLLGYGLLHTKVFKCKISSWKIISLYRKSIALLHIILLISKKIYYCPLHWHAWEHLIALKMKYERPTEAPIAMAILIRSWSHCRETYAAWTCILNL